MHENIKIIIAACTLLSVMYIKIFACGGEALTIESLRLMITYDIKPIDLVGNINGKRWLPIGTNTSPDPILTWFQQDPLKRDPKHFFLKLWMNWYSLVQSFQNDVIFFDQELIMREVCWIMLGMCVSIQLVHCDQFVLYLGCWNV